MIGKCLCLFVLAFVPFLFNSSPLTNPLTADGEIGRVIPDHFESRKGKAFHDLSPDKRYAISELNLDDITSCAVDLSLQWSKNIGQPVLATPVIYPGTIHLENKNIFIATLRENIELFEGDGSRPAGWPLRFPRSTFQAGPLVFDIDGDGFTDVGVTDESANLYWIRVSQSGKYLEDYHIQVPKLRIKRDWMEIVQNKENMNVYVSLSRFDRRGEGLVPKEWMNKTNSAQLDPLTTSIASLAVPRQEEPFPPVRRRLSDAREEGLEIDHGESGLFSELSEELDTRFEESMSENIFEEQQKNLRSSSEMYGYGDPVNMVKNGDDAFNYYMMRRYGYAPMEEDTSFIAVDPHILATPAMADINQDGHMEVKTAVSYFFDDQHQYYREKAKEEGKEFSPDLYVASGLVCWDMELQEWLWTVHLDLTTSVTRFPAVIYSTPTIADLDGDGRFEIIIGTSVGMLYVLDGQSGFTRRFFPIQFHSIHAQVAVADVTGGSHLELIVVDMAGTVAVVTADGEILWDRSLSGSLPFTPTVADIDQDGQLDVIIVTVDDQKKSHIFALRGDSGDILLGFPVALPKAATISGPIIIANLDLLTEYDDPIQSLETNEFQSFLEMDQLRAPSALRSKEKEYPFDSKETKYVREMRLSPHLVVTSLDGRIYILQMKASPPLPFSAGNKSQDSASSLQQTVSCIQKLEFSSPVIASPLLEDVTNDGYLDLIVASLNGEVSVYETSIPFHPTNAWNSFPKDHGKSFTYGDISVSIDAEDRKQLQRLELNHGQNLSIQFEIVDRRCLQKPCSRDEYRVRITKGSDQQHPIWRAVFAEPGQYIASFAITGPENSVYAFTMETKFGKFAEDFVAVTISTRFYVWLKYLIVCPILLFCSIAFAKVSHFI